MESPKDLRTIEWLGDRVRLIDQTRLPHELVHKELTDYRELAESIRRLEVRGAPAIGVAGALGVALAGLASRAEDLPGLRADVERAAGHLAGTRPTAVNLRWAVERTLRALDRRAVRDAYGGRQALIDEAKAILEEDRALSRRIGEHGAALVQDGDGILTHCNAGGLATAEFGTALAVVFAAVAQGKRVRVYADETRPLLQGARLTTWELMARGVDVTLLVDGASASAMARGWIDRVIVGADRIARNGDVANKIGTFPLALAARHHGIPFFVAAPYSTLDLSIATGADIPIEERSPDEVTVVGGVRVAPEGVPVYNPAFDVTPADLVSAIITDRGVVRPPYGRWPAASEPGPGG
jgi:methylthioribose-1-phosphate isomerase